MKHRWIGQVGPQAIPADELAALVRSVTPDIDPDQLQPLTGGFRNWNYRMNTKSGPRLLRVYTSGDRSAWKEQRLAELVAPEVVTPRYLDIEEVGDRVVAVREFVEGIALHELLQAGSSIGSDVAQTAGRTLAAIHRVRFDECGDLDTNLNITERYDMSGTGIVQYVRSTLAATHAAERLGPALTDELLRILEKHAGILDPWREHPVLAHGDFGPTNLVLCADGSLSVLDWEFGCSAMPALDFGNLLRPPLEHDDAFARELSAGYRAAGGSLPRNWRRLALLVDVMAWVAFAARPRVHELVIADARNRIEHTVREFSRD